MTTSWTKITDDLPEVEDIGFSYASRYVLVKTMSGNCVSARLSGNAKESVWWCSGFSGKNVVDVVEWMEIPK